MGKSGHEKRTELETWKLFWGPAFNDFFRNVQIKKTLNFTCFKNWYSESSLTLSVNVYCNQITKVPFVNYYKAKTN